MQRQIKFTASGASSAFGAFAPGDVVRCDAELARHFVQEAHCAVFMDAVQTPAPQAAAPSEPVRKSARKPKLNA